MKNLYFQPTDYIAEYSQWDMLVRYLKDYTDRYQYNTNFSREETLAFLVRATAVSFENAIPFDGHNPGNLLTRALNELSTGNSLFLGRDNLLRLILALGINNLRSGETSIALREANHFLLNYMHEPELSARNLQECIFIWCIHNNLSTISIVNMIRRYKAEIRGQRIIPAEEDFYDTGDDFYKGGTSEVLDLLKEIRTQQQLERFINSNLDFFAKLGNTHYCSLFNDVSIFSANRNGIDTFFMGDTGFEEEYGKNKRGEGDGLPVALRARSQSDRKQIDIYYDRLFGLHSLDEEEFDNYLDAHTITRLTDVFPSAFLKKERFINLVRRKTGSDVPYGVNLIHMLIDMPFVSYIPITTKMDPAYSDLTDADPVQAFKEVCDDYLNNAGFPSMNKVVPIDRLVLDTYVKTIAERKAEEYKDLFLYYFREALVAIANTYKPYK